MLDVITAITVKNMAREMVKKATANNMRSDAELLRIYEKAEREESDLFFDLTKPKYGLTKQEEKRAIQLAVMRDRKNLKDIGHERAKRIAERRDYLRGKY